MTIKFIHGINLYDELTKNGISMIILYSFVERTQKMKSTGIVRKVDELGRIVLPIELRRTLGIDVKDLLEIYVEGSSIVLKKYEPEPPKEKGRYVCAVCQKEFSKK